MNYELVNLIQPETENWKHQQQRGMSEKAQMITLAPDPQFCEKKIRDYKNAINVIDLVTNRTYYPNQTLFFDKVETVDGAEIFMNPDGVISIISDGVEIGQMRLYANTRHLVKSIVYFNADGSNDYEEEYTTDGKLFSYIYYWQGQPQQIAFVNDKKQVVLRFHFYEGQINLISEEDPITSKITRQYDDMTQFLAEKVANIVTSDDTIHVSYLGRELDAISLTKSDNSLYLEEAPDDENGEIKGNLNSILDGSTAFVSHVVVNEHYYEVLKGMGAPMGKVEKHLA